MEYKTYSKDELLVYRDQGWMIMDCTDDEIPSIIGVLDEKHINNIPGHYMKDGELKTFVLILKDDKFIIKRGRPRKYPIEIEPVPKLKRKRGRPRKEEQNSLEC